MAALAVKVLNLVPNGKFMRLFQLTSSINSKSFWKNLKITGLDHFVPLLEWLISLKGNSKLKARFPLIKGDQIKDFINKKSVAVITDMVFTPSMKSSAPYTF